jgi:hypothetical protein
MAPTGDGRSPAAPERITSTVDPEARRIHKNRQQRDDGYQAHPGFR